MLATDLNFQLSDNFRLYEAVRSQIAARRRIDNRPPIEILPKLSLVARKILEPARAEYGTPIIPSSWYRCHALERALKGRGLDWKITGQHPKGEAVDFEVGGIGNLDLAKFVRDGMSFDQLILEYYEADNPRAGWVHVSYVTQRQNRREVLTYDGLDYRVGLPE